MRIQGRVDLDDKQTNKTRPEKQPRDLQITRFYTSVAPLCDNASKAKCCYN